MADNDSQGRLELPKLTVEIIEDDQSPAQGDDSRQSKPIRIETSPVGRKDRLFLPPSPGLSSRRQSLEGGPQKSDLPSADSRTGYLSYAGSESRPGSSTGNRRLSAEYGPVPSTSPRRSSDASTREFTEVFTPTQEGLQPPSPSQATSRSEPGSRPPSRGRQRKPTEYYD